MAVVVVVVGVGVYCKFQVLQTSKAKTLNNEREGNEVNPDENGLKGSKARLGL